MNDDFDYQGCEWDGTNWKNCEKCGAFNESMNDCCTECCFEFYPEDDGELPECCVEDPTMVCKNHRKD